MTDLISLCLPIIVSAVIVFIASSVIHMAVPWHKDDYQTLPNEAGVLDAMRPFNIPPGDYMAPRCTSMKEMKTPEFTEKMKKGPVVVMTVLPSGPGKMGAQLALWFIYSLVVSTFAAYVAGRAKGPGTHYLEIFRFAGTTAFAGYALGLFQQSIWYKRSWGTTIKYVIDGLLYALLTAGTFGWLWPK